MQITSCCCPKIDNFIQDHLLPAGVIVTVALAALAAVAIVVTPYAWIAVAAIATIAAIYLIYTKCIREEAEPLPQPEPINTSHIPCEVTYPDTPLIPGQQELERGIEITDQIRDDLYAALPLVLGPLRCRAKQQSNEAITWFPSAQTMVFRLPSIPGLIFKMPRNTALTASMEEADKLQYVARDIPKMQKRFQNMANAQAVCKDQHLEHLRIPHAKLFYLGGLPIIAEEYLELDESIEYSDEAISNLAHFVIATCFSDVAYRNIPLKDRQIVLVDLEEMDSVNAGLYGQSYPPREGLISCLSSEAQIEVVKTAAVAAGVFDEAAFNAAKAAKLKELNPSAAA